MHIIPSMFPSLLMVLPFVVAFIGLRLILWGPLNDYMDARETATDGARAEAAEFDLEADKRATAIEAQLVEARKEITDLKAAARVRAQKRESEIIAAAREVSDERLSAAHQRIADERLKAKTELEVTAKTLSSDIVTTLLA